ncbi:MAG TPA: thioesterase family protein [Thermoanaerobaculia bacterium]|jgi:acyl-CoA thioester hydrolase|nr:thioesterase family protein [Thermoanaerobaculia bacterium]
MTSVPQQFRGAWRDGWYVLPYQVMFRDVDAYGHVNNAVFFTYFEWVRTLLWFELTGFGGATDIGFIVAHAECDYRRPVYLEAIDLCIRVGAIGTSSFETLYEIRKTDGSEVAATGKVVVVLYDWARDSKKAIDDDLRRKLAECSSRDAS